MRFELRLVFVAASAAAGLLAADAGSRATSPTFDSTVKPVFTKTCFACHNDRLASGGLNITPFLTQKSITEQRDEWERIIQKMRTGEMPPKGIPRPPEAQVTAILDFVR